MTDFDIFMLIWWAVVIPLGAVALVFGTKWF